ncbi:hypothetical protein CRE_08471 [Caenorhabditis remanei]|uniref:Uncharacterized protein n=1 Tax=Caenorhabditis remanei TaxID=31234 RepID=E3N029_CAERE|nr:hypothetical protein CRE_08471 [Caenorhabditis remanei]
MQSMFQMRNRSDASNEIDKIISPEDRHKDGDIEFILKKYPIVAQYILEDLWLCLNIQFGLETEKDFPADRRKEFWNNCLLINYCCLVMKTPAYKNGNKKHNGYKICCEMNDYCSFYKQTWFFIVCGAVGFLLLVAIAGGVFFIIRRKNKKKLGGGNKA